MRALVGAILLVVAAPALEHGAEARQRLSPGGARCAAGFELLLDARADPGARQALRESMRAAGCLGRPQQLPRRRRPRRSTDDEW